MRKIKHGKMAGGCSDACCLKLEGLNVRLEGEDVFYSISAAQNREVVTLNVGDRITVEHAVAAEGSTSSILDGYSLSVDSRAAQSPEPQTDAAA